MTVDQRIHENRMNSNSISKAHPDIYREFFERCEVIVSVPGVFFWAGEHAVLAGGLSIVQHVPLRVYVGIEPTELSNSGLDLVTGYQQILDPRDYSFTPFEDPELQNIRESVAQISSRVFPVLGMKRKNFRVHLLSELLPGRGANWSGSWSTAFVCAALLHNGMVTVDNIGGWKKKTTPELTNDANFRQCSRNAWKIENAFHDNRASGYGIFGSMVNTGQPILYWTQKRGGAGSPPIDLGEDLGLIDKLKIAGASFTELFGIDEKHSWPFQYGLVNSGLSKRTGHQIKKSELLDGRLNKALESVINLMGEKAIFNEVNESENYWLQVARDLHEEGDLRANYRKSLITSAFLTFYSLKTILTQGSGDGEGNLMQLAQSVRSVQEGLEQLDQGWYLSDLIELDFYKFAKAQGFYDKSAMKLTGAGGGGMKLFTTPILAQESLASLLSMYTNYNLGITFDWLYSIDGLDHEGVRIEKPTNSYFSNRLGSFDDRSYEFRVFQQHHSFLRVAMTRVWETDLSHVRSTADIVVEVTQLGDRTWKLFARGKEVELKELKRVAFSLIHYLLEKEDGSEDFQYLSDEGIIGNYKLADLRSKVLNRITNAVRSSTHCTDFLLGDSQNGKIFLKLGGLKAFVRAEGFNIVKQSTASVA